MRLEFVVNAKISSCSCYVRDLGCYDTTSIMTSSTCCVCSPSRDYGNTSCASTYYVLAYLESLIGIKKGEKLLQVRQLASRAWAFWSLSCSCGSALDVNACCHVAVSGNVKLLLSKDKYGHTVPQVHLHPNSITAVLPAVAKHYWLSGNLTAYLAKCILVEGLQAYTTASSYAKRTRILGANAKCLQNVMNCQLSVAKCFADTLHLHLLLLLLASFPSSLCRTLPPSICCYCVLLLLRLL